MRRTPVVLLAASLVLNLILALSVLRADPPPARGGGERSGLRTDEAPDFSLAEPARRAAGKPSGHTAPVMPLRTESQTAFWDCVDRLVRSSGGLEPDRYRRLLIEATADHLDLDQKTFCDTAERFATDCENADCLGSIALFAGRVYTEQTAAAWAGAEALRERGDLRLRSLLSPLSNPRHLDFVLSLERWRGCLLYPDVARRE